MAQDRTNMVSLFDVGSWLGGSTPKIVEMGDGFNEISEDWGPQFKDTQYVNMKNSSSSLNGYQFSMTPEREYLSDDLQEAIDTALKKFPTGAKAETCYYRFFKTDKASGGTDKYNAIKVPIVAAPSSAGGSAGDALTTSIEIHGNGDAVEGFITIDSTGQFEWSES